MNCTNISRQPPSQHEDCGVQQCFCALMMHWARSATATVSSLVSASTRGYLGNLYLLYIVLGTENCSETAYSHIDGHFELSCLSSTYQGIAGQQATKGLVGTRDRLSKITTGLLQSISPRLCMCQCASE